MIRSIALFVAGAVPAAAAAFYFLGGQVSVDGQSRTAQSAGSAGSVAIAAPTVQLAAFRAAETEADPVALEAALRRALAQAFSVERDVEIAASFKRLAALDLRRALRFAAMPEIDPALVAEVFRGLATVDRDAALAQLAAVGNAQARMAAALAMIDLYGDDAAGIAQLADALPEYQRIDFQAQWLANRARTDPTGAMSVALALRDPATRNTAAQRVGSAWAQDDPIRAMLYADALPRELQDAYREVVAVEWARLDTPGFLAYADSLPTLDGLTPGLKQAMAVDPQTLFDIASRHPPLPWGEGFPARVTFELQSFTGLAQRDPQAMADYVASLPDDPRRQELMTALAEVYGRVRPAEALAWARSLDPPKYGMQASVIAHSAMIDIDQAMRWMYEFNPPPNAPAVAQPAYIANLISSFAANDPRRTEIADTLRQNDDPRAADLLLRITNRWVQIDPASALDWILESSSTLDPALAASMAGQLAGRDAKLAVAYLDRMPGEFRDMWRDQIVVPYASQDPEGAAAWITRFQGEPGYDNMVRTVIQLTAQTNPQSAAAILSTAPAGIQMSAASSVASGWAQEDLIGAGRWALSLSDEAARTSAVSSVANTWASRDPAGAERWAVGMPESELRDQALSAVLTGIVRNSYDMPISERLLESFTSDAARDRQISNVIAMLASRNPDRAESLLDDWITDERLRQSAEAMIESARRLDGI